MNYKPFLKNSYIGIKTTTKRKNRYKNVYLKKVKRYAALAQLIRGASVENKKKKVDTIYRCFVTKAL
jgi:hypothetical protein